MESQRYQRKLHWCQRRIFAGLQLQYALSRHFALNLGLQTSSKKENGFRPGTNETEVTIVLITIEWPSAWVIVYDICKRHGQKKSWYRLAPKMIAGAQGRLLPALLPSHVEYDPALFAGWTKAMDVLNMGFLKVFTHLCHYEFKGSLKAGFEEYLQYHGGFCKTKQPICKIHGVRRPRYRSCRKWSFTPLRRRSS